MKVIQNIAGYFFVTDKGFAGKTAAEATQFEDGAVSGIQNCLKSAGIPIAQQVVRDAPVAVLDGQGVIQNADGSSIGVRFVRAKDIRSDKSIAPRKKAYSGRTFRTEAEAKQHGARFARLEGHRGYVLVPLANTPVNSWVNEGTGRTNPEIKRKRTNRV